MLGALTPLEQITMQERPIVDGFTHSLSMALLPIVYRAQVLAQMETLRRATNYQFKMFSAPDAQNATIPAFSQNEYLVKMRPGTLVWGTWLTASADATGASTYIQITDLSTGSTFMSDYEIGKESSGGSVTAPTPPYPRHPRLLPGPRLVSGNGQVTVEIYNSSASARTYQLVLFCAEPMPTPEPCADPAVPCNY